MKKIAIPMGLLCTSGLILCQTGPTSTENYIQSKTYLDYNASGQSTKTAETVQYFDGLGRPKQIVNVKASPLGRDVVTHIEYDAFGRQAKDFLPVPQAGTLNGAIVPSSLANATEPDIYGSEKIFSEKVFQNSPLDRIIAQRPVGNAWEDKPVAFWYDAVTTADAVKKFSTTTIWENGATKSTPSHAGIYQDAQLYKNTVIDEDGNQTIEFKNGRGQVILLRKVVSASENADTYYVYNEYNQLAFVVPPLLAKIKSWSQADQDNLAYEYRYDGRNRLVEKKLPGKDWETMIYDKQDRLVGTQDAELRKKGQWLYTKYDQFGRTAITGLATGNTGTTPGSIRIAEQNIVDGYSSNNVNRLNTVFFERQGMDVYYGNPDTSYPNSSKWVTLLSLNYYDSYPAYSFNPSISDVLGESILTGTVTDGKSTKGLPVMSFVKNIEDDNWTKNYTYYDTRGRVVGTYSINHLGGYTQTESKLDFAGVPQNINTYHLRKPGESGITVKERFVYDHQNRLKEHYHQVDDKPEQLLAENSYNELSQLKNKKVGNNLQSIDYTYNIRGWMSGINKDQMTIPDLGGKLFSYKIKYNQKEGITNPDQTLFLGKDVKAKYNGNIAEIDWRAIESIGANPSLLPKRYGYAYDSLNRLTAGYYQNPQNPYSKENIESLAYDLNGNVINLYRTSVMEYGNNTATVIDHLDYTYTGNQAVKIKDISGNKTGYEGTAGFPIDYDTNGNMTSMMDKQITGIGYNYLNLPNKINIGVDQITTQISTKYRADGVKLRKENVKSSVGFAGTDTTMQTTDYLDGFQYYKSVSSGGTGESSEMVMMSKHAFEPQAFTLIGIPDPTVDPPLGGGGILTPAKTPDLQFFPTSEGFYDYAKNQYIYSYKDQVGNIRISYGRNNNGNLEIVDANDYYPFGMNHLKTGNAFFGVGSYKSYKMQGQELQETGFYAYKWRQYMSDVGRFFSVDPLSEQFPYNSTYAFQENKLGMGVELEGLELLKNHTGFFAIHGNDMKVKRAPISQISNGRAAFTAGGIGLSTNGYNPGGARMSSGTTGLKLNSYKYNGPLVGDAQLQNMKDYPVASDRQRPTTTKTGAEMWNLKQTAVDKTVATDLGVREIAALIQLGANIPDAVKSMGNYVQASKDVKVIEGQAMRMDDAINYVDSSGIEMNQQTRNDVVNYVYDGTLPDSNAGLMPNSLIIQNGTQIMKDNGIPIQPLDQQLINKNIQQ
ncbi:DUF6443 domain-containing protein [Chryseobacterium vrystaatense]|uniref:RHS repeat-associated core domain-containing protein n=1 Tax=Chryseobacterium vrystaatense TaxID=307480 RepID=A0A1M5DVP3_9FLAO|nr:DUF6443 domain-containing protein [Chryseobacterium vrystaatense]SHF71057.1 RHS repeat-associated core domain-containing protein [Chryseobacterium vrystaatense]